MIKCILYIIAGGGIALSPGCYSVHGEQIYEPQSVVYTSHVPVTYVRPRRHYGWDIFGGWTMDNGHHRARVRHHRNYYRKWQRQGRRHKLHKYKNYQRVKYRRHNTKKKWNHNKKRRRGYNKKKKW